MPHLKRSFTDSRMRMPARRARCNWRKEAEGACMLKSHAHNAVGPIGQQRRTARTTDGAVRSGGGIGAPIRDVP